MNSPDSFRNPFSEYSANSMDPKKILDYWCSPFTFFKFSISEKDIFQDKMPIVLMGGRGTGKTMFLRYLSYPVQRDEALAKGTSTLLQFLKERGGVGLYIRIDGIVLRSFEQKGISDEIWDAVFVQYFELLVCKSYFEIISDLVQRSQLDGKEIHDKFVPRVAEILGIKKDALQFDDVLNSINDQLEEINSFRSRIAFSSVEFTPTKSYSAQELSFGVARIARETLTEFKDGLQFLILIDEYENYSRRKQVILNSLLKFVTSGVTFRVGMRLEGFHTYDTVSRDEFIKEGRDYTKFIFEEVLIKQQRAGELPSHRYAAFLKLIAKKRLEGIPEFKSRNFLDISRFLGTREDLEQEAKNLVKQENNPRHFDLLNRPELFKIPIKSQDVGTIKKVISKPEHPLLELLNIIWVFRGNTPEKTRQAMEDYLAKRHTQLGIKYRLDYVDKYKLSLMILLASIHKKPKMYYSFNTFCFLSSGIVGEFIELCRRSFQYAYFEDPDLLIQQGRISIDLQNRAARDLATAELDMVNRIVDYGHAINRFARNMGNLFEKYQKDPLMRYPETNQFTIAASVKLDDKLCSIFQAAVQWSVIQLKPTMQRGTPRAPKTDIYTLNRTFSPAFDLTYRTRGAHSDNIDNVLFNSLTTEDDPKVELGPSVKKAPTTQQRLI